MGNKVKQEIRNQDRIKPTKFWSILNPFLSNKTTQQDFSPKLNQIESENQNQKLDSKFNLNSSSLSKSLSDKLSKSIEFHSTSPNYNIDQNVHFVTSPSTTHKFKLLAKEKRALFFTNSSNRSSSSIQIQPTGTNKIKHRTADHKSLNFLSIVNKSKNHSLSHKVLKQHMNELKEGKDRNLSLKLNFHDKQSTVKLHQPTKKMHDDFLAVTQDQIKSDQFHFNHQPLVFHKWTW